MGESVLWLHPAPVAAFRSRALWENGRNQQVGSAIYSMASLACNPLDANPIMLDGFEHEESTGRSAHFTTSAAYDEEVIRMAQPALKGRKRVTPPYDLIKKRGQGAYPWRRCRCSLQRLKDEKGLAAMLESMQGV